VAFWVSADDVFRLALRGEARSDYYTACDTSKASFMCDTVVIEECGSGHPSFDSFVSHRRMFEEYWSNYRDVTGTLYPDIEKGYLRVIDF
jgi:hypothetical protein